MEGSEAVLGSSVNFAVCTREVPPATNGLTDCQKRYHRRCSGRNVDYSSLTKSRLNPAASAKHPPPAPGNTLPAARQQRTPARHTARSPPHSPPEPPTPPPSPLALGTSQPPPRTTPYRSLRAAPTPSPPHSPAHPSRQHPIQSPCPQQNPAAPRPPPSPQQKSIAQPRYEPLSINHRSILRLRPV